MKVTGVNLTLIFTTWIGDTTEMQLHDKKDLHKTWSIVCLLIGRNSDLHDVLHSDCSTSLFSRAKFLETVDNGGKSALFNTKEAALL